MPVDMHVLSLNVYQLTIFPQFIFRFFFTLMFGAFSREQIILQPIIEYSNKRFLARHPQLSHKMLSVVRVFQLVKAKAYYDFFNYWFQKQRVDLVVVWNGLPLPVAAAVSAAKSNGIKLIFCENGYLPKTVVMDPKGVNAFNSLMGKNAEFYQQVQMKEEKLRDLFEISLIPRQLNQKNISAKYRGKSTEEIELPMEFIFLPLQVHDDSQILIHSPNFNDMYSLVNFCAKEIRVYNEKYQGGFKLVVKEHPSDYGRIDYEPLRKLYPEILFTKTAETKELIQKCKAVITVNSTVGIESLLYFKPVITLGNAFYNVPMMVFHLEPQNNSMEAILFQVLHQKVDQRLIEHFLYYLRYEYLVSVDRRNLEQTDPKEAVKRIIELM
jgi:capsular polysaccharide export protein